MHPTNEYGEESVYPPSADEVAAQILAEEIERREFDKARDWAIFTKELDDQIKDSIFNTILDIAKQLPKRMNRIEFIKDAAAKYLSK